MFWDGVRTCKNVEVVEMIYDTVRLSHLKSPLHTVHEPWPLQVTRSPRPLCKLHCRVRCNEPRTAQALPASAGQLGGTAHNAPASNLQGRCVPAHRPPPQS